MLNGELNSLLLLYSKHNIFRSGITYNTRKVYTLVHFSARNSITSLKAVVTVCTCWR
jgi:hypothetical protein